MRSGSAEASIQLAHVLAGQLLKFCDCAICCNAPALHNSQNLNLDFLQLIFEFIELGHMGVQANA